MNERPPGPSRRPRRGTDQGSRARGREREVRNQITRGDVPGFRVTLHPQARRRNEYYVKFTPLSGSPENRPQTSQNYQEEREASTEEEHYELLLEPEEADHTRSSEGHLQLTVTADPLEKYEETASEVAVRDYLLEAILGLVAEGGVVEEPSGSVRGGSSRGSGRLRNRNTRRRRRRSVRQPEPSEPSMYEVVDVDYETISELKPPPRLDWRIVPRYELSSSEASRQEKELFYLLTSETNTEPAGPAKGGEPTCCICHENAASRVVVPCGHRCLCRPCALHIVTNRSVLSGVKLPKLCPICQAAIGLITRLR